MTMKTILRSGLALAAVMTIGMAQAQVKDDMKAAGHDTADATKTAAHKTAHGTKVAAKDTGHAVKKGTKKTVTERATSVAAWKTSPRCRTTPSNNHSF